jgi:hypothetical protein
MGSHVFLVAFFAAEEELLPLEGNGVGVVFGNITLTDRVLDHLLTRVRGLRNRSLGREEGSFDHPIDHDEKD